MPLTEPERAYFAGILDGEGSISLVRSFAPRTRGRYVYPIVRVANTDDKLILWLHERIIIGSVKYNSKINDKSKLVHHIGWASWDAVEVLSLALPYLVVKKERARIVLELWAFSEICRNEAGGYFGNGHPIPQALVDKREEAFALLKELNKRGVDSNSIN